MSQMEDGWSIIKQYGDILQAVAVRQPANILLAWINAYL